VKRAPGCEHGLQSSDRAPQTSGASRALPTTIPSSSGPKRGIWAGARVQDERERVYRNNSTKGSCMDKDLPRQLDGFGGKAQQTSRLRCTWTRKRPVGSG